MTIDDLAVLDQYQLPAGTYLAGPNGYGKIWLRDNVYVGLALEAAGQWHVAKSVYQGLLDIIHRHSWKIDWIIEYGKPSHAYEYIHPRYHPNGDEIWEPWGNKQHDALGDLLWRIAVLENAGVSILRDDQDLELLKKLVSYLTIVKYWHDPDSGIWEEGEEVHASSVAACTRAIEALSCLMPIPDGLAERGQQTLEKLLPHESHSRHCDLALLSLVWPLGFQREDVLVAVEQTLLREHGVIRYQGDWYHRNCTEAEWPMGLPWLGLCWFSLGDRIRARRYLDLTERFYQGGYLPECYSAGYPCEHTPLVWAHALTLALRCQLVTAS